MSLSRCKNGHMFSEKKHGKICPYCYTSTTMPAPAQDGSAGPAEDPAEPDDIEAKRVVGWLVCVAGTSKGKDYRIMPEKNFVGRADDMDIKIWGDKSVNFRNHAIIMYDPEKNHTVVLPGASQGLVYKFDNKDSWEVVYEPKELASGDRLKVGSSEFIFVGFCGNNDGFKFSWRDYDDE